MVDYAFTPPNIAIDPGTTVCWINHGVAHHTVTEDNLVFSSGDMAPNQTFTYTFNTPGTYNYKCLYHLPGMVGSVTVWPSAGMHDHHVAGSAGSLPSTADHSK